MRGMLLADDDGEAVRSVGGVGVGFACAVVGGMGPHPWPVSCGSLCRSPSSRRGTGWTSAILNKGGCGSSTRL